MRVLCGSNRLVLLFEFECGLGSIKMAHFQIPFSMLRAFISNKDTSSQKI